MVANGSFGTPACHCREALWAGVRWCTADKWQRYIQHAPMHLICPHCQANYDIARDVRDAVLVCHQCAQEFSVQAQPWLALRWQWVSPGFAPPPWQRVDIFAPPDHGKGAPLEAEPVPAEAGQAPVRKTAHIWPWLLMILILLAVSGFWVQSDAWLDNRRVRSSLINIGFDMALRAKDWRIAPASVQPEWIKRTDGSRILLVRGNIQNLLNSDMPLPEINMIFFSKTEPDKQIGSVVLDITLQPSAQQTQQMPYIASASDVRPVSALANRGFTIVAQSVPEKTGDFTLTPAPR